MAGLSCVMVGGIPRGVQRPQLLDHFGASTVGGGRIDYILHPLGNDMSMAVIKFTDDKVASSVLQHDHDIGNVRLQTALLPRQVLAQCQADVDPLIVAGLPDIVACMDLLRSDFGVKVSFDSIMRKMSISGSFLQIQFAQAALNSIYRQQEELRQRKLNAAADAALGLPLSSSARVVGKVKSQEMYLEARSFSPLSFRSDHYSEIESPPRTLKMEDLTASLPLVGSLNNATPQMSLRSDMVSEGSLQEMLSEQLNRSMQSSTGISAPLASSTGKEQLHASSRTADNDDVSSVPPGESVYTSNDYAVDAMFASNLPKKGPHPSESIQEDDLLTSAEMLRSGTLGKSDQRIVLEFNTQLFDYMRRVQGRSLKDLEHSYQVQLQYKKSGDNTMVRILPAERDQSLVAPLQAKTPLINLYKTMVQAVSVRDISLRGIAPKKRPHINEIVTQVKEDFKNTVFVDTKDKTKLTVIGEDQHVHVVDTFIRDALGIKKEGSVVKPKMIFMMQSSNLSASKSLEYPEKSVSESQASNIFPDASQNSLRSTDLHLDLSAKMDQSHLKGSVSDILQSPRGSVKSLKESINSARESTRSPRRSEAGSATMSPRELLQSPRESIKSPRDLRSSERLSTGSPRGSIQSLRSSTKSPRQSMTSPRQSMTSPRQSVASQLKSSRDSIRSQRSEGRRTSTDSIRSQRSEGRRASSDSLKENLHIQSNGSGEAPRTPREPARSPLSPTGFVQEESVVSTKEFPPVQRSDSGVAESAVQPDVTSPRAAWPTPEPRSTSPLSGQPLITSNMQCSVQTSMTGVTPLSSQNLSTGDMTGLSYTSTGQSLELSKSVDLGMSHASNTESITGEVNHHLSRVSFVSTGELQASMDLRQSRQTPEKFKFMTKEGVNVMVYKGEIAQAEAEVIVCPVGEDLHLLRGVALDISNAAGPQLQHKCSAHVVKQGTFKISEVLALPASGNLSCQYVLCAAGPMWCLYPDKAECETVLKQTFINSLTAANQDIKATSIAIPPIGTGEMGVPADVCAWALLAAVEEYSSTASANSIKEVHIINTDARTTAVIGETLQEVLVERESTQGTPECSPRSLLSTHFQAEIPFIARLAAACVSISERAGAIIRDVLKKGELGIVEKGINDLQTEADRSAEKCIVASLKAQFPGIMTVGEESGKSTEIQVDPDWIEMDQSAEVLEACKDLNEDLCQIELKDVVVWVDPLDGTSEYTQGLLDHVTTLIGIGVKGVATAGVIHQPFYNYKEAAFVPRGHTMWGMIGLGAFGIKKTKSAPDGHIIVTTRSHGSGAVGEAVDACEPTEVVRVGGCGHKVALILQGKAHAYVFASPGCKKWDTAAPEAILHAAGGTLTDIHGNQLEYWEDVQRRNAAGVLATPPGGSHAWYLERIPDSVKEALPVIANTKKLEDPMHQVSAPSKPVAVKTVPFIVQLTAACVSISERAGAIIRDVLKKGELGIVEKGINDLQTEADRSAEKCIVASLKAQFPGIVTVGEESGKSTEIEVDPDWIEMDQSAEVLEACKDLNEDLHQIELKDVVVWVDPLDGTSEYTQGLLDHVTTLIGIGIKGVATAGVIHQPFYNYKEAAFVPRGHTMWGMIGLGAFGIKKTKSAPDGHIIVTTRSHGSGAVGEAVDACEPTEVVRVGGCGHKVALILQGKAHAYVFASPGCKKWDTAAPEAILHAAGGTLTDIHGNQLEYWEDVQRRNAAGVLATPPGGSHAWYLERIPDSVKEALPVIANTKKLEDPMHTLDSQNTNTTCTNPGNGKKESSSHPATSGEERSLGCQPKNGEMSYEVDRKVQLPGYSESPTIIIRYIFPAGKGKEHHSSPGKTYGPAAFTAYLPNTSDGRHVLQLLRKAFDLGMTFNVQERAFGVDDLSEIMWADIPHKTSMDGGKEGNGYPDDGYLEEIKSLLEGRGINAAQPHETGDS